MTDDLDFDDLDLELDLSDEDFDDVEEQPKKKAPAKKKATTATKKKATTAKKEGTATKKKATTAKKEGTATKKKAKKEEAEKIEPKFRLGKAATATKELIAGVDLEKIADDHVALFMLLSDINQLIALQYKRNMQDNIKSAGVQLRALLNLLAKVAKLLKKVSNEHSKAIPKKATAAGFNPEAIKKAQEAKAKKAAEAEAKSAE